VAEGNAADFTDEAGYTVHSMDEILLADSVRPSFAVVRPLAAVGGRLGARWRERLGAHDEWQIGYRR